tara:strand:- start:177 stop:347 length:171 start_codon:yes stop_codon:yes gene_type:complete
MNTRMKDTTKDLTEVALANIFAGGLTLANANEILTTISIFLAITLAILKIVKTLKQ